MPVYEHVIVAECQKIVMLVYRNRKVSPLVCFLMGLVRMHDITSRRV